MLTLTIALTLVLLKKNNIEVDSLSGLLIISILPDTILFFMITMALTGTK